MIFFFQLISLLLIRILSIVLLSCLAFSINSLFDIFLSVTHFVVETNLSPDGVFCVLLSFVLPIRSIHTSSNISKLNPFYVTGFSDAESCFLVSIVKRSYLKTGWSVAPNFKIKKSTIFYFQFLMGRRSLQKLVECYIKKIYLC